MANPNGDTDFLAEVGRQSQIRLKSSPEFQSAIEEARRLAAQERAAESAPAQAPGMTPNPDAPELAAPEEESPGIATEAWRAGAGAVVDAATESVTALADFGRWYSENLSPLRFLFAEGGIYHEGSRRGPELVNEKMDSVADALVAENETGAGKAVRAIGQFAVPFLGAVKALSFAKKAGNAVRGMTAGAVADAAAFDPHEKRLSNLIMEWSNNDPIFGDAVFEYLAADPTDSAAEGRMKNALEGLGLGLAAEGVFKGLRIARDSLSKGGSADPLEALEKAAAEHQADVAKQAAGPETQAKETMYVSGKGTASTNIDEAQRGIDPEDFTAQLEEARLRLSGSAKAPAKAPEATKETVAANLESAVEAVKSGKSRRRAWVDLESDTIAFDTAERAPAGAIDFDTKIKAALERAPVERTAEDLIVLRKYKQMQEATFRPLITPTIRKGAAIPEARRAELLKGSGTGDADRIAAQESGDALIASIKENSEAIAKAADKLPDGPAKSLLKEQGGYASPTLMAHIASGGVGGVIGVAQLDDDATLGEKAAAFLGGAAAGLGFSVGGLKVAQWARNARSARAAAQRTADEIAKPAAEGIMPKPFKAPVMPKGGTRILASKVDEIVSALTEGRTKDLADALETSDFNLARMDTTDEMDEIIDAFSNVFSKETLERTRGVEKFTDTKELAKDLGVGVDSLAHLSKDAENLSSRIFAHRAMLAASAAKVNKLARQVAEGGADSASVLALRKQVAMHGLIQTRMKGITTEVGRALGQFRIQAPTTSMAREEVDQLVEALGGFEVNKEFARRLAEINDPRLVNSVARNLAHRGIFARAQDALFEVWVNGILGGLSTHVVNIAGNASVAGLGLIEKGIASMIGGLRHGDDAIKSAEVTYTVRGMVEGIFDVMRINAEGVGELSHAARLFASGKIHEAERMIARSENLGDAYKAFAQNTPRLDSSAHQSAELLGQTSGLSASNFAIREGTLLGKTADYLGAIHRTMGGRMLTTSDEIFKTMLYRGELRALAYREGTRLGLKGENFETFVKGVLEFPTDEMSQAALEAARRGTFTTPLGEAGRALTKFVHATPGLRFIAPFVRTPLNILKFVGERTPLLNLASSTIRADLAAGGIRRDMVLARTITGGMLFLVAGMLKEKGLITGGGDEQQTAERLAGQQQYSLKVGDQFYSFNRLDPIGMFFGLVADAYDLSGQVSNGEMDDIAASAMLALQRNLVSRSYVKGVMDMMLAVSDTERYGERFVQRFVSSWIPNYLAQFNKITDDEVKEVWSVTDAIKAKIPWLSGEVPAAVNQLGEDVHYTNGLGPDIAAIVRVSTTSPSPLANAIVDMNVDLRKIPRMLPVQGTPGIELTPKQYYRLSKIAGTTFKEAGEKLVASKQYQRLPEKLDGLAREWEESREIVLKRLWSKSVQAAKAELLKEDRALRKLYENAGRNRAAVLQGRAPTLPLTQQ